MAPLHDFDLCVVLPGVTPQVHETIFAIAWEIGFAEGCVLAPIVMPETGSRLRRRTHADPCRER